MEITIQKGVITCVQQDDIDLALLGHVTNRRASTVEWLEHVQLWCAEIKPEFRKNKNVEYKFHSTSRQACIDWEVKYLEERISENSLMEGVTA